ncbi:MAG: hypothetical protein ACI865_003059 [Flavobacteriaceae bacterium]|jgi:hypothetical protein
MKTPILFILLLTFTLGCERNVAPPQPDSSHYRPYMRKGKGSKSFKNITSGRTHSAGIDQYKMAMPEESFWEIINLSVLQSSGEARQVQHIENQLIALGKEAVLKFELRMQLLLYNSYTSDLLCAGELLHHNCGNFEFEQFRCWIILQGEAVYYLSLNDPDTLEVEYRVDRGCYNAEALYSMPSAVYKRKYNKDIYQLIDMDKFPFYQDDYPPLNFKWRPNQPGSMSRICPDLYDACY